MPDWYMQIASELAFPYVQQAAEQLASLLSLGIIPGIISLMFAGPESTS